MIKMGFIKAYIKSMRPYTFFITGIAGLVGMLLVSSSVNLLQRIIVLLLLFSSYGINQIINDLIGTKEDKINAPKRPIILTATPTTSNTPMPISIHGSE